MEDKYFKIKLLISEQYEFPCSYKFKFIVPTTQLPQILTILCEDGVETKASSKGNYISVTYTQIFKNEDEIIEVYKQVENIEGIISM